MEHNLFNYLKEKKHELIIFIIFFSYFIIWNNLNFNYVKINNNSLSTAIEIYSYTPYVSLILDNLFQNGIVKIILGNILFPSLVSLILFIIFKKITSSNLWSYSLTLLSMSSNESYPFINFLIGIIEFRDLGELVNKYENFEIIGFPIPSFSILYFSILFFYSISSIRFHGTRIYILTFFWFLGPYIHPVDGILGIVYWITSLFFVLVIRKIKISRIFYLYFLLISLISIIPIIYNLELKIFLLNHSQNIPLYNFVFYLALPLLIIIFLFVYIKIDKYEFYNKFLNIYILMIIEIIIILFSINGIGLDLKMFQNRITLFLLHYLYYAPIIYYLNKDEIFIVNKISSKNKYMYSSIKFIYYLFNKYKSFYLVPFNLLIILYFILSLRIYD